MRSARLREARPPREVGRHGRNLGQTRDCHSGLHFRRNKLRKLEYIIPDAIASDPGRSPVSSAISTSTSPVRTDRQATYVRHHRSQLEASRFTRIEGLRAAPDRSLPYKTKIHTVLTDNAIQSPPPRRRFTVPLIERSWTSSRPKTAAGFKNSTGSRPMSSWAGAGPDSPNAASSIYSSKCRDQLY